MSAADDLVRSLTPCPVWVNRDTLTLGYAGAYSSFLRHAETMAARHDVSAHELLPEGGRQGLVRWTDNQLEGLVLRLRG